MHPTPPCTLEASLSHPRKGTRLRLTYPAGETTFAFLSRFLFIFNEGRGAVVHELQGAFW